MEIIIYVWNDMKRLQVRAKRLQPQNERLQVKMKKLQHMHTGITPLKKKMSAEEMAIYILEYCSTWRSVDEIAKFADRDKDYIRNKVLPKLTEKLEREFPDVPNHPKQKYRTKKRKKM